MIIKNNEAKLIKIHTFAKDYLLSWFPKLHSYAAFNNRINRLASVFQALVSQILNDNIPADCVLETSLLDLMPIITSSGKRKGKVATELTDKGYCSTKSMYYYGVKLHALSFHRKGKLPHPEELLLTPASENDLHVFGRIAAAYIYLIFNP